jgi:hypothetical protein
MRLLRMPIDLWYDILAVVWVDAITATEVATLTYFVISVIVGIMGLFICAHFDNTATETYMH